jgi:hypothetical protein
MNDDLYLVNGVSMKHISTRFRTEFSLLTLAGAIVELGFVVIMCFIGDNLWYIIAVFLLVPFGLARSVLLLGACIADQYPWLIASVETLNTPSIIAQRRPNALFRLLGFRRPTSFVRALCYTRDFRGVYGTWCLFAKLIHHFVFIASYLIIIFFYLIIPGLHHSNYIRKLLLIELFYIIFTTYFDHFVIYRILSLRSKAKTTEYKPDFDDPTFKEIIKNITFE